MSLFFWITGYYFTLSCGPHSGDEGHYLIQANSLYYDHDLDIYNNLDVREKMIVDTHGKGYMHISPNSKNGHYYSWHPFGLSFLLSFAVPGGVILRHLLLGILAGLGCGGMLLLSRMIGAEKRSSFFICGLFWFSTLWGIYAARALPETGGATLTLFLAISVLGVEKSPRLSLLGAMICCLSLPWLHIRFLPISAIGGVFFLFNAYRFQRPAFKKWLFPAFLFGVFVIGGLYITISFDMFESGTGYISTGFFNQPFGMLEYIGGTKGMVEVLPIIGYSLWVVLRTIFFDRDNRYISVMVLLIILAILATSCSSTSFCDGAAMRGRMMLVGVPLTLPLLARFFDKAGSVNRWFILFLSVIPVFTFVVLLIYLPVVKRDFAMPYEILPEVAPFLRSLSSPFASPGSQFGLFFFLGTFLLIFSKQKMTRFHLAVVCCLCAVSWYWIKPDLRPTNLSKAMKQENTRIISSINLDTAKLWSTKEEFPKRAVYALFANRLEGYSVENTPIASIIDLPQKEQDRVISQDALEPNDWNGRNYKWVTLAQPFPALGTSAFVCLSVEKSGNPEVDFAAVELLPSASNLLLETKLSFGNDNFCSQCFALRPADTGNVHLLTRLYGEPGYLRVHKLHWLPLNAHLLDELHLTLPYSL
ncbi:MAG TPA: hypothetical protein EYP35_10700 [Desulfobacterales bacterium]|nr:hypothetical protein [Desulfobacterales bacterium]